MHRVELPCRVFHVGITPGLHHLTNRRSIAIHAEARAGARSSGGGGTDRRAYIDFAFLPLQYVPARCALWILGCNWFFAKNSSGIGSRVRVVKWRPSFGSIRFLNNSNRGRQILRGHYERVDVFFVGQRYGERLSFCSMVSR